ncbi:MAG: hypothetical protein JWO38_6476 [Gemmataceae bacterium]|nr:hypothetical protein [Gemmataceae bacterium]
MIRWTRCGSVVVLVLVVLAAFPTDLLAERCALVGLQAVLPNPFGGPPVALIRVQPAVRPAPPVPPPAPGGPGGPRAGQLRPIRPSAPTPAGPSRFDRHGDPLPAGAVARLGTVRLRHGNEPSGLAFTPDGKLLGSISPAEDGIRLWDPATGKEVARLNVPVTTAVLARDGSVVIGDDTRCKIWLPAAGSAVRELPEKSLPENVSIIAVHPDCRTLAAGTQHKVVLIDLQTGNTRSELKVAGDQPPLRMGFSPDGRWLAAAGQKTGIWLWDLKAGKRVRTYQTQADLPEFAFAPDGKRIAIAGDQLRVYSLDAEEPEEGFTPPENPVLNCRFSSDSKSVFGQFPDGTVTRYDAATGEKKESWPLPGDGEKTVRAPFALAPNAAFAAAVDESGGIRIWEPKTGKGPEVERLPVVSDPGFSADGKTVSCVDAEGKVRTFDPLTGKPGKVYELPVEPGSQVTWDARSGLAVVQIPSGEGSEVQIIEGITGKVTTKIPAPAETPVGVSFCTGDRDRIALVSGGAVSVLSVKTGKAVRAFPVGPAENPLRIGISPDGRLVAVTTSPLSVWEVGTGKKRFEIEAIPNPGGVTFAPDGRHLAAWGDAEAVIFDLRTGTVVRRIQYPAADAGVGIAEFTPDAKRLITGGQDGLITVWDVATGNPVVNLDRHDGTVTGLALSADGKTLVSTAADGTALVWDLSAQPGGKGPVGAIGADEALRMLASPDPAQAQRGIEFLYRSPTETVKLLADKIPVPTATPAERVAKLVAALGSEDFLTRQSAARDLEAIGAAAGPAVRAAVEQSASPEVRTLAAGVLTKIEGPPTRPDDLRALRAVEVLEGISSPEAREVLKKWAAGPAAARLTVEAAAALGRTKVTPP